MLLLWAQVQRIKLILLLCSCQVITLVHGISLLFLFFPFKKCSWKCVLIFCTWILYLHTRFYVIYFMFPNVFSISTVFLRFIHVVLWIHLTLACNSWAMGAYCSMGATTTITFKSISQWWTSRLSSAPHQRKQPLDNLVDCVGIFWVNITLG